MFKILLALGLSLAPQIASESESEPTTEIEKEDFEEFKEEVKSDLVDLFNQRKETEVIGGITWGAIISTCISVSGVLLSGIYYGKKLKTALKANNTANEQLDILNKENEKLKNTLNNLSSQLEEYNKHLEAIEQTNKNVDLLLESQVKMACTDDSLISSGYAKELKEKVENNKND